MGYADEQLSVRGSMFDNIKSQWREPVQRSLPMACIKINDVQWQYHYCMALVAESLTPTTLQGSKCYFSELGHCGGLLQR